MTAHSYAIIRDAPPVPKRYPFAGMAIGDAFDAPRDMGFTKAGADRRQHAVASAAGDWARRNNPTAKFSTRCVDADTVRCWRVA